MTGRIISLFVMAAAGFAGAQTPQHPQNVLPVTDGWKFVRADVNGAEAVAFDDSKWSQITLPHTWNDRDTLSGGNYYRGPGWYRIKLAIPETAPALSGVEGKDKRVFIRFEAASSVADVYFNGVRLGQHRGGFTAFCYELTPHVLKNSPNVLAVRVDNSFFEDVPPLGGDFNIYGGIYRSVWLIIKNQVCITPLDYGSDGVYIKQTKVTKEEAIIDVAAKVSNGLDKPVWAALLATEGSSEIGRPFGKREEIGAGKTMALNYQIRIANPHLWNGRKDPYMYQVRVLMACDNNESDSAIIPIGLRYYSVDPNKGFFLNGESYPLHGVCRHQDRIGKGWAISYADQDEDANLILEMGATCVRLAHYPHSNYFVSLCDKAGLVVWTEIPLVNQVYDTNAFAENAKQQLTELIRQKYNHPSIFVWGLYNELGNSGRCDDPRPLLTQLNALAKQEDPTRLTTAASNDPSNKWPGVRKIADLIAWNTYPGWYKPDPTQMAKDIDRYKKDANDKPLGISEYGAGASIKQHEQNIKKAPTPGGKWHPEEWQAIVHEENYAAIEARPYLWGSFTWVMFDFSSAWRKEGDANGVNDKGLVTADRKTRKDAFYFYKAKWTTPASSKDFAVAGEPFVYITSRRHTERTDPNTTVKVYSNCDSVELKINGQTIGSQTGKTCVFKWFDIRLKPGLNTIEASATRDGRTCTDKCEWTLMPPVESNQAGEPNK